MTFKAWLTGLTFAAFLAAPAFAQTVVDQIVLQLREQGYVSITADRTLLGRMRITAENSDSLREIIVNPRTGEILRDFWQILPGAKTAQHSTPRLVDPGSTPSTGTSGSGSGSSGSGSSGSGSDDDDNSGSDDSDDDNSGSGSDDDDNSGSDDSGDDDNSGSGSDDDDD